MGLAEELYTIFIKTQEARVSFGLELYKQGDKNSSPSGVEKGLEMELEMEMGK